MNDLAYCLRCISKLWADMYEGDGPKNPAVTARLLVLEGVVDKISKNLNRGVWLLASTFLLALATFITAMVKR